MEPIAALIPIKDHSERVPGKNFRPLLGAPLWEHIVRTLSAVPRIEKIFIDTDSQRFTPEILAPYPKVQIIERPLPLRGDFVSTNKLFAHDLSVIDPRFRVFLQTHTTNPLLTSATVADMIEKFEAAAATGTHDSLFTVTAYFARFYQRNGAAVNHDPKVLLRTQDLEPLLEENSNLYLFTRESFATTNARIGARPLLFEMNRLEATDIDDQETWELAEALMSRRGRA